MSKEKSEDTRLEALERAIVEISQTINMMKDHLLLTREQTILRSETLPSILYQIKNQAFEMLAQGKLLAEVQEELAMKMNSFLALKRENSALQENLNYISKYIDTILQNLEALRSEKEKWRQAYLQQQRTVEALETRLHAYEKLESEISTIIHRRRAPQDVIAELSKVIREARPPPQAAPPATPLAKEEEGGEEEESEEEYEFPEKEGQF